MIRKGENPKPGFRKRVLTLSVRVIEEDFDDVNVLCAGEGVSSNANA